MTRPDLAPGDEAGGGPPLLEARDLTRVFGHGPGAVTAVNEVSFTVGRGEIIALVGESGSGKSTLARLLLRLLAPTSGQLLAEGVEATSLKGRALRRYWRHVQAVFQDPFSSFNQFFVIERTLVDSLRLLERPPTGAARRERIEASLQTVGLDAGILGKYPHELSGGQRQRVMMARALMLGPRLLVADEPTSMLDASLRANVLNLLGDIRTSHGMSIVFITHDLGQACYLSDRVLVMYRGNLVEGGPTDEVLWNPQDDYTKRLLADVPRLKTSRAGSR